MTSVVATRSTSDAASARELPLLEAFLAEHRAPLRRTEGHRCVLAARRTLGLGLDAAVHRRTRGHPVCPLGLASLAALGFVLELLVGEEQLFTCGPDELRRTIHTPQDLVLELHRSPPRAVARPDPDALLRFAPELLSVALPGQSLLGPALVTRLQVERVLLDVLDDVFLLNLTLEATEGALDRLAFLNLDFSHASYTPSPV